MKWTRLTFLMCTATALAAGCGDEGNGGDGPGAVGIPVLGNGAHTLDAVQVTQIGSSADGLNGPRDLEFHNTRAGELWVTNRFDDSTTTFYETGTPNQSSQHIIDAFAIHFMEEVSSLAFGKPDEFGTCQESRNTYDGQSMGNDFMGPALWSANPDVYGFTNPEAVRDLGFDLGSHLDMLHESPLCMGIAHDEANVFWTFDGQAYLGDERVMPGVPDQPRGSGVVSRYDFQADHGPGYDDHDDGIIEKHIDVNVRRTQFVPSHMELDHDTGLLYVADTGNSRVLVVDTNTGTRDSQFGAKAEPATEVWVVVDTASTTLVDSAAGELAEPSGLALRDGFVFVSDHATGRISAFDIESGELVDWLETGLEGSIMGLEFDPAGNLYAVDYNGNAVWQYAPL